MGSILGADRGTNPTPIHTLASGDMAALLTNPKIRRLADDPAVQSLTREVER